ncbi:MULTISPECIES: hypothetical protein [Streptomyces]|uniref:Uncharacterized protein n=1 Tax=Streptomyces solicathayae TaxID=3081768 RepID=A0ABZ0LWB1_9ACTN|nr:hypothetical protein [Streptomyces sp. HUAS YS2]WOX23610.1 hypothetical protein R2D22_20380 [Streptomyces sp. HUAS YS2]
MRWNLILATTDEAYAPLAATGSHVERLWLLGGLALAAGAIGVVARAAARAHRDR